ncbi:hypothetical protein N7467_005257 [Penicillium canescens]|nr:hypothetical protein N7467_005257 [Penicillium canescens]
MASHTNVVADNYTAKTGRRPIHGLEKRPGSFSVANLPYLWCVHPCDKINYDAPPVGLHLAQDPAMSRACLSSLRVVTSDGALLPPDLIRAAYDRLKIPVRQAIGLTELTSPSHFQSQPTCSNRDGTNGTTQWGSTGLPLPRVEVKFMNEQGDELQGEGDLCLRDRTSS